MSKTTIDGLAVRESSKTPRRKATASKTTRRKMDVVAHTNRPTQTRTAARTRALPSGRAEVGDSLQSSRRVAASRDTDFLSSVQSFGFDEDEMVERHTETLGDNSDTSWSDLLGELGASRHSEDALDELGLDELDVVDTDRRSVQDSTDWLEEWGGEEDPLEEEKPAKRAKKSKKSPKKRVAVFAVFGVLIAAIVAVYFWGDGLVSRLTGGNSGLIDAIWSMVSDEVPFLADENGRTNVLVFGTEGYNMAGAVGDNAVHDGAQLTDSIMVVSFNQETKDVALLSLPRDLKVPMACSAGKINEVFWCHNQDGNNEEAGAQALMTQVGEVLGLEFQYYAHVNWASLIDIIDAIGGVTVTLDEDINDYAYTGMVMQAGVPTTINGEQALGLARARHGTTGGDFTRGNTQQKIVGAIAERIIQNGIEAGTAVNLLNILGDNLRTNFSADNIKAAMRFASGFNVAAIRQVPLVDYENGIYYVTTATINDISYVVPAGGEGNYRVIQKYIEDSLKNDGKEPEDAGIAVYNATDGYGVAGAERDKLEADGYTITGVGNAEAEDCESGYCLFVLNDELTQTKAALETRYGVTARPAEELPGDIWPDGADFVLIIGATDATTMV